MNTIPENKEETRNNLVKSLRLRRVFLPVFIGIAAVAGIMYYQLKDSEIPFDVVDFSFKTVFWLLIAGVLMVIRDFSYMVRFKILTEDKVTWYQAFRVIMLWEFTSAVSPSAVGGTSVAVIFIHKEGISIGRSSAIVMATSFLDEFYFVLMFPVMVLVVGPHLLFSTEQAAQINFTNQFFYFAVVGYSMKLGYNMIIAYGLFKNPKVIKNFVLRLFGLKILRRWRKQARRAGLDIVKNSEELRRKPFTFWLKAFGATFISWTARYWVVNAIFLAFFTFKEGHLLVFAKQLVMWIMMLVSPTPGGSGFSEFVFSEYLSDFMPQVAGIAIIIAFVWRLITYYPYFIIGAFVVPRWIQDKFGSKK